MAATKKQTPTTPAKRTISSAKAVGRAAGGATQAVKSAATRATKKTAAAAKPATRKTAARRGAAPDAIAVLKRDHQDVETLFKRFEGLGPTAHKSRQATVAKVIEALSKHAAIEELVLYPDARARFGDDDDIVLEALEEHHIVKWTLSELDDMQSSDERYTAKVTVLMESVRHHVKEEEKEFFPKLRKAATRDELSELGDRLRQAKRSAPTRPHPRSPDTPPANIVTSAITAPLDTAARLAGSAADKVRDLAT